MIQNVPSIAPNGRGGAAIRGMDFADSGLSAQ
jgi:hypothetical protein